MTSTSREAPFCGSCGSFSVRRDYQAEAVGLGSGVKMSRDGTLGDQARMFLPEAKDFAKPGDPDGIKGLNNWNETHGPRPTNNKPRRPDRPPGSRRSF